MKLPKLFVPEKDFERKIGELMKPEKASSTKRVVGVKEFYSDTIDDALTALLKEDYEPLLIPSIVDMRIEASKDATVWKNWYCSPSIRATGKTRQGKAVVVYAHVPNYFSNPDNIKKIKEAKWKSLMKGEGETFKGAVIIPDKEFQRLLDLEDNKNIFVVDYNKLKSSESGVIKLKDTLKHPQTIPCLGGRERAEEYLERHEEVYGKKIGAWHYDDSHDEPFGRLLFVGGDFFSLGDYFREDGRFVGVHAEGATQNSKKTQ